MVYSVRAKLAVRITARFADPRPFCPVIRDSGRVARLTDVPDIPPVRFFAVLLGLALFVPAAAAGCRIGPRHPIEAATKALAECPSLPLGWKTDTVALRGAAASSRKGSPCLPVRDWIWQSPSCTCRGLVMDLSCTRRIPAPVTYRITCRVPELGYQT